MNLTPDQLVEKWKHVLGAMPLPTWTTRPELALLAEHASQAECAVELGSFQGMSAFVMLKANPKLHLWAVDIFTAFEFNQEVCAYFLREFIAQGRCELIKGDSVRAAGMLKHMAGRIDLCFVDDGHLTEDVLRDIHSFYPLLKHGGVMLGHDFESNPINNVAQGVIRSGIKYFLPLPRIWASVKP